MSRKYRKLYDFQAKFTGGKMWNNISFKYIKDIFAVHMSYHILYLKSNIRVEKILVQFITTENIRYYMWPNKHESLSAFLRNIISTNTDLLSPKNTLGIPSTNVPFYGYASENV